MQYGGVNVKYSAFLAWSLSFILPVQKFIYLAARYAFDEEQALAILHSNRYQLEKARADLKMFAPLPSQWPRDKSVFIHAFKQESKYFYAIKDKFVSNSNILKKKKKFKIPVNRKWFVVITKQIAWERRNDIVFTNKLAFSGHNRGRILKASKNLKIRLQLFLCVFW